MGFRAHLVKREVDFENGFFNWESEDLLSALKDLGLRCIEELSTLDGDLDLSWRFDKNDLITVVETLKQNYDPVDIIFADYTAKELIKIFEYWINSTDSNVICIDWL